MSIGGAQGSLTWMGRMDRMGNDGRWGICRRVYLIATLYCRYNICMVYESAYVRRVGERGADMSEIEREVLIPSDEEEEAIQRGIALDPDAPEWTDEDWARARPAVEAVPHVVERHRRTRGRQRTPTKEKVTVRLDADIVAHFREGGRGWQTRLNEALRQVIGQ